MPSDRKQFNVRMSDETAGRVERLIPLANAHVGLELSQAQFFALAVKALEEKLGATPLPPAPPVKRRPKG